MSRTEAERAFDEMGKVSNVVEWAFEEPLYDFQRAFLDDHTTPRMWIKKTRQCGWSSRMSSCKGLIKALAIPGYKKIFTSHSMDDCKEKITYANECFDRIKDLKSLGETLPDRAIDHKMELSFTNGSRLISVFIPRGKDKADIDHDEFAHYNFPRKIFKAAQPILIHPGTQGVVASSPTHSHTMFAQIGRREGGKFANFVRAYIYWWDCTLHCTNVPLARLKAPDMSTEERVETFGTTQLQELFQGMFEEDFQEEFELQEQDDHTAYIPWPLIISSAPSAGEGGHNRYSDIRELRLKTKGKLLYGGLDVGRRVDKSELHVFVLENGVAVERYHETMDRTPFAEQMDRCRQVCRLPNMDRFRIDQTGMGEPLAEALSDEFKFAEGVTFTLTTKNSMASNMRAMMENDEVRFYASPQNNLQMHSVKKAYTKQGNLMLVVDTTSGEGGHHHADVFWGRALALCALKDDGGFGRPGLTWI